MSCDWYTIVSASGERSVADVLCLLSPDHLRVMNKRLVKIRSVSRIIQSRKVQVMRNSCSLRYSVQVSGTSDCQKAGNVAEKKEGFPLQLTYIRAAFPHGNHFIYVISGLAHFLYLSVLSIQLWFSVWWNWSHLTPVLPDKSHWFCPQRIDRFVHWLMQTRARKTIVRPNPVTTRKLG